VRGEARQHTRCPGDELADGSWDSPNWTPIGSLKMGGMDDKDQWMERGRVAL